MSFPATPTGVCDVLSILGNKYALMAFGLSVGLSAALTWHYVDKAAAVRNAQQELADKVTIATQKAQLDEMARRAAIAAAARLELAVKVAVAENDAEQATQELENYENNTEVNPECVVDDAIIDRLSNR